MSELPDQPVPATAALRNPRSLPVRWLLAFGTFWWDFLVGDTPELFIGTAVTIGAVALLAHAHVARYALVIALPVLAVVMLGLTVYRGRS